MPCTAPANPPAKADPGNRTKAIENNQVPYEVVSAILWPTVSGMPGHFERYTNVFAYMDTPDCNPEFVQIEVDRLHQALKRNDTVDYLGGVEVSYTNITYPCPITDLMTRQQGTCVMYGVLCTPPRGTCVM
jgi:hypothetical protein